MSLTPEEAAKQLAESADKLNDMRDDITMFLAYHEGKINSLKMGIEVAVRLKNNMIIGYGRNGKRWGFMCSKDSSSAYIPISECSVEIRAEFAANINYVLKALEKETIHITRELQTATIMAKSFLTAMGIEVSDNESNT